MKIAIIGSHGTGKTTILRYLQKEFPRYVVYEDIFRSITKKLGYDRPRSIYQESGMLPLVSAALGEYANLDKYASVFLDQAPIVLLAYYYAHDGIENAFVKKLVKYYSDMIDLYIYLPVNVIPLVSDEMRPVEIDFQHRVDLEIQKIISEIIPKEKIYKVKTTSIHDRILEVSEKIKEVKK